MLLRLAAALFLLSGSVFVNAHDNPLVNSPFDHAHAHRSKLIADTKNTQSQHVSMMWFAGWHQTSTPSFTVSQINWSKYTHVAYSFATPTNACQLTLDGSNGDKLGAFVQQAHGHGVKVLIAIGGWAGSRFFSSCANPANVTAFAKTTADFVKSYNLDGVNIDWEYPNSDAIGCNVKSPQDSANYLVYLQKLRSNLPKPFVISLAAGIAPFKDANGSPLKDVSAFAAVLDMVNIMAYDIWGMWSSSVGPNAPLNDTCAASQNQQGSAVSAVAAWSNAKMPRNQLVLGVPAYGHSFLVTRDRAYVAGSSIKLAPYNTFDASAHPKGDAWAGDAGVDVCGNNEPNGDTYTFWGLVKNGFLDSSGKSANGISYRFDECSQTPYVYNPGTQIMVSFDNSQSFCSKGKFIKSNQLGGFAMWEAGGDYNDILLNSITGCMYSNLVDYFSGIVYMVHDFDNEIQPSYFSEICSSSVSDCFDGDFHNAKSALIHDCSQLRRWLILAVAAAPEIRPMETTSIESMLPGYTVTSPRLSRESTIYQSNIPALVLAGLRPIILATMGGIIHPSPAVLRLGCVESDKNLLITICHSVEEMQSLLWATGVLSVLHSANGAAVISSRGDGTVPVTLDIVNAQLAPDGFSRSTITANGTYPGPPILVQKGQTLSVTVNNLLTDPSMRRSTSLDFDGIFFSPDNSFNEGTPFVTTCPIAGTFWYHSQLSVQYVDGLRGAIIVYDPEDPHAALYDVDDESTIIQVGDWWQNSTLPMLAGYEATGIVPVSDSGTFNGVGRFQGGPEVPWPIVNVVQGKRYRFRIINQSARNVFTLSIDSHNLTIIETDGVSTVPHTVDLIEVLAGQRYSVVVAADQAVDNYWFNAPFVGGSPARNLHQNATLTRAVFRYEGAPEEDPTTPLTSGPADGVALVEADLRPLVAEPAPVPDVNITLDLVVTAGKAIWNVNNVSYLPPQTPTLVKVLNGATTDAGFNITENTFVLPPNATIQVDFPPNDDDEAHPFHMHGMNFWVVKSNSSDAVNTVDPIRRDVTGVGAAGTTIRFRTDKPGKKNLPTSPDNRLPLLPGPWFFHCHIFWHMQAGLATVMLADPEAIQDTVNPTPEWADLCPAYK
ncbi:hypothetical protein D9757_001165 [Collybiopsis confluens]|uniref:GH18 domain-containing protein n=1 Tax=Collybiopsis confluens TaxID=2823264 RepID=A0A8H5I1D0_9AGAR|nr:hypothetical protein D9757_001165 [Collybiopsis confluens]